MLHVLHLDPPVELPLTADFFARLSDTDEDDDLFGDKEPVSTSLAANNDTFFSFFSYFSVSSLMVTCCRSMDNPQTSFHLISAQGVVTMSSREISFRCLLDRASPIHGYESCLQGRRCLVPGEKKRNPETSSASAGTRPPVLLRTKQNRGASSPVHD